MGELPELAFGRWLDPTAWHLTLQFLGDVEEGLIDEIRVACAFACGRVRPFPITFEGFGAFPHPRRARVVWVGVQDSGGSMATLATAVQDKMAKVGFGHDQREYRPHLTVARLWEPSDVSGIVAEMSVGPVRMEVSEAVLMRSDLLVAGASYEVVDSFPLQT